MALTVLNKGSTTDTNTNCPTNPKIKTNASASASAKHFTIVHPDDSANLTFDEVASSAGLLTEYTNLATTPGHIVKQYNAFTQEGIQLIINTTHYWFILLYSDDPNQHHFARITESLTDDVSGDSLEFTPKLGQEIPKGTKFMLFKGPLLTSNAIAFSAGIDDSLRNDLVCSRPLFYIEETKVNKKGELDHNTKYFVQNNSVTSGSTVTVNSLKTAFMVEQDFSNAVVDYSPYSLKVTLTDVLRNKDVAGTAVPQESSYSLPTEDFTDYEDVFYNARRQNDDDISGTIALTGPTRYLHYDFSPTYCNHAPGVIESEITDAIGTRSGFANVKIIDNNRIIPKKVSEEDPLRVRHMVHTGDFFDWFALKATLGTHTANRTYNVTTEYDLTTMLNVNDEVKLGSRILIVEAVAAAQIQFNEYSRLETEGVFTNTTGLTGLAQETLYRRAYNSTDKTLLTSFNIIEDRDYNLFVRFHRKNFRYLYATVTGSDKNKETLTLSFSGDGYDTNPLKYLDGRYQIFIERFDGAVESIQSTKEQGQTYAELEGRNNLRKLLSPIINSNKLFSKDMIYSSKSFYNTMQDLSRTVVTSGNYLKGSVKTFEINSTTTSIAQGDELFGRFTNGTFAYIGEVASFSSVTVGLVDFPKISSYGNSVALYKRQAKSYVLNKALAANYTVNQTSTALEGAADKGIMFDSGTKLDSSGNDDTLLVGTSSDDDANALGYPIHHPSSMKNDRFFQSRLKNTDGTNQTFDLVNSLIDFSVLNIAQGDTETTIELAPYVPLTLGRVDINSKSTIEKTFENIGTVGSISNSRSFTATSLSPYYDYEESVYVDGVFIGKCIQVSTTGGGTITVYLDRRATASAGNLQRVAFNDSGTYYERQDYAQSLALLNAAHLHGGKVVGLLGPKYQRSPTSNTNLLFEAPVKFGTTNFESYIHKFGTPLYRIFNLEKGNINYTTPKRTTWSEDYDLDYYSDIISEINYYADAYRFGPGYYQPSDYDHITGVGRTGSSAENQHLFENQGFRPASNSRFFDTKFHKSGGSAILAFKDEDAVGNVSPFRGHDVLDQIDPKVSRMFLFVNSDVEPYSGKRKDSILNPTLTRSLTNYSIMLKKETNSVNSSTPKDHSLAKTQVQSNIDADYESYNISSSDSVTSLKQFGLMRLTECVYDWHFNQIDPENLPDKKSVLPRLQYQFTDIAVTTSVASAHGTSAPFKIIASNESNFSNGDIVCDDKGNVIGVVSGTPSGGEIPLTAISNKTGTNGAFYTGTLSKVTSGGVKYSYIQGRGREESFHFTFDIHMLKGAVVDAGSYAGTSNDFFDDKYSATLQSFQSTNANIFLPPDLGEELGQHIGSFESNTSQVIGIYQGANAESNEEADLLNDEMLPVFLDRFSIENSTNNLTPGTVSPKITKMVDAYKSGSFYLIGLVNGNDFYRYNDTQKNASSDNADGAYLGFKFRLKIDVGVGGSTITSSTLSTEVGDGSFYRYVIQTADFDEHYWLNLVNSLSGCYLVSEQGTINEVAYEATGFKNIPALQDSQVSINGSVPDRIAYVVSHEIDTSDSTLKHIIITDKQLTNDYYRIMQPNHVCTYDFTPKTITMNQLSSKYTKMNGEQKTYDSISSYLVKEKESGPYIVHNTDVNQGGSEAALSMYVIADLDRQASSEENVVYRSAANIETCVPHGEYEMCVSDGITTFKTSLVSIDSELGTRFSFSQMQKTLGVPSVSETFTLTVPNQVSGDFTRANIGVGVTIGHESERIVNDLLEENGISFDLETQSYPRFASPNFQGIDLLSAINYITKKKELRLVEEDGVFKVRSKKNNSNYTDVVLSDFGEYQIFNYSNEKTIFDKYNEIVVFGREHKSTRKNLRDIKKNGKKTLEVFERELASQSDVDDRATELFLLHSRANQKLKLEVGHKGISQLRPGDIINVEIRRENIPLNQYYVLEVKHLLTGNMVLELGLFSKKLEDRFAELLVSNRQTNAAIREQAFNENTSTFDVLETLKVKPLRLLVRKRSSAGATLGFGITLGFGSTFTGLGTITETNLVDVEY
jgi:hypothetical protein